MAWQAPVKTQMGRYYFYLFYLLLLCQLHKCMARLSTGKGDYTLIQLQLINKVLKLFKGNTVNVCIKAELKWTPGLN